MVSNESQHIYKLEPWLLKGMANDDQAVIIDAVIVEGEPFVRFSGISGGAAGALSQAMELRETKTEADQEDDRAIFHLAVQQVKRWLAKDWPDEETAKRSALHVVRGFRKSWNLEPDEKWVGLVVEAAAALTPQPEAGAEDE